MGYSGGKTAGQEAREPTMRQSLAPGEVKTEGARRTELTARKRDCAAPVRRGWSKPEIEKAARQTLARNREAIAELAKW